MSPLLLARVIEESSASGFVWPVLKILLFLLLGIAVLIWWLKRQT